MSNQTDGLLNADDLLLHPLSVSCSLDSDHVTSTTSPDPQSFLFRLRSASEALSSCSASPEVTSTSERPTTSQHRNPTVEMNEILPTNKKLRKDDKICGVCGDKALGYNFDAISCESCKAFFRRNALKGPENFRCPYEGKCVMDVSNRRFCKRCRLEKCFTIGMRKEYILSEDEKQRKRKLIEFNRQQRLSEKEKSVGRVKKASDDSDDVDKKTASTSQPNEDTSIPSPNSLSGSHSSLSPNLVPADLPDLLPVNCSAGSTTTSPPVGRGFFSLSDDQQLLLDELVSAYRESLYSANVSQCTKDADIRAQVPHFSDMLNVAEIGIRRVINMTKRIQSFKDLSQADQIALLKGGSIELLVMRSALSFDKDQAQFLDCSDSSEYAMSVDKLQNAQMVDGIGQNVFEDHMRFVQSLRGELDADEITLILLLIVCLFSPDRPNLQEVQTVANWQEKYSQLLWHYLLTLMPYASAQARYPRLLLKLTDLRSLDAQFSDALNQTNMGQLRPLMKEVLAVPEDIQSPSPSIDSPSLPPSMPP